MKNLKNGKNKYSTFFFKEYAGIAEKNTYSAYIPNEGKGLWVLAADSETEENFAKTAVEEVARRYMEDGTFSMENMNRFLNEANKITAEMKARKGRDYTREISILAVTAEKKGNHSRQHRTYKAEAVQE